VGLPQRAEQLLSKFMWGQNFLRLNAELFEAYVECEDSAAVVAAQDRLMRQWQGESDAPTYEMPPSDSGESIGESEEESGDEGIRPQAAAAGRLPPSDSGESEGESEEESGDEGIRPQAAAAGRLPPSDSGESGRESGDEAAVGDGSPPAVGRLRLG
jgi:pre-rRNA-processing protein TSR3